jgi:predicted phosphodiesterase
VIDRGDRDFLASFQESLVIEVDGLGETLFCHGSPRSDEEILTALTPEDRWRPMFAGVEQQLVVCGHTDAQSDRVLGGVRVVNAGSVGMPYEDEPGAYWLLDLAPRRTPYDGAELRSTREEALSEFTERGL